VLLLDEIEKAHPDIYAIRLQVMDHATLTDIHGRKADFRHEALILTTNAGARALSGRRVGFSDAGVGTSSRDAIEKAFTPEFRNRLDAVVTFAALGRPEILKVVDKNLKELQAMLAEKQVTLQVLKPAEEWLADRGYEPAFGARPEARVVEQHLKKPLADAILFGALKGGGTAKVERKRDGVAITAEANKYARTSDQA
jgi:ATP-dependent Clp protease ATP-binding subunit ClpA